MAAGSEANYLRRSQSGLLQYQLAADNTVSEHGVRMHILESELTLGGYRRCG